jgi:predicted nucleic acid-binding protein
MGDADIEGLISRLQAHDVIGLDTAIFIYHFEAHPRYLPLTTAALSGVAQGERQGVTSVITLMELTVRPHQLERPAVAQHYEALLSHFPHLTMVNVDRAVARRAAELRGRYRVRPADALQVAASLVYGATAFLTNDRRLARLQPLIDIILLDDFLA